jgi:release factor glutamine methyltransferase
MSVLDQTQAHTIADAGRALARTFRAAGRVRPELDARLLIEHALGLDRTAVVAAAERALGRSGRRRIAALADRRLGREPVARIVGVKEFWGLRLRVSPATLVPRPDSETVVEAALAAIGQSRLRSRQLTIADLGTGSGALLLALLSELPHAVGVGTDISREALVTAAENARELSLDRRATFVACDFGAALVGGFDLVVSNPPYVESDTIATLEPEVRDHDPRIALDGGADGLAAYRSIGADACRLIAAGGHLIVEIGAGQAIPVGRIMTAFGLEVAAPIPDLEGIARVIQAGKHNPDPSQGLKKALGLSPQSD